jgi:kynurenine formamidase
MRNSPIAYESPKFVEDNVHLDADAAVYLAEKKIRLFGFDCITIGNYKDEASIVKTH